MTNTELKHEAEKLIGAEELARKFRVWITGVIRQARRKAENANSGELFAKDVQTILDDLNTRAKRRFSATDQAKHLIRELLSRGYTVVDFQRVHEVKCAQWLGNDTMDGCLRPSTLYRPSHFDEYLGEWDAMNRKRIEKEANKALNNARLTRSASPSPQTTQSLERKAKIEELCAVPWHSFATWGDFMKHTVQFPDADALAAYHMPERIKAMRSAPINSIVKIYSGQRIEVLEEEYALHVHNFKEGTNG